MSTLKSKLKKESVMSSLDLLASESKDFNHFLQKFKKQFPKIAVTKSTLLGLKKMFDEMKKQMMEVAPEGWEGTVKAMKKDKSIENPWALAHWMKGKGYKSHKESVKEAIKGMLKEIQVRYDFSPKELEKLIQTMKRHNSTEVKMIAALEKALGKKVRAWDDVNEAVDDEDCGCNQPIAEQPIHTSNRLSLKVGLQK